MVLGDFGLSRETQDDSNKAVASVSTVGPVRWMAVESLRKQEYSIKSDGTKPYVIALLRYRSINSPTLRLRVLIKSITFIFSGESM